MRVGSREDGEERDESQKEERQAERSRPQAERAGGYGARKADTEQEQDSEPEKNLLGELKGIRERSIKDEGDGQRNRRQKDSGGGVAERVGNLRGARSRHVSFPGSRERMDFVGAAS